ncbi:MAG: PPC domain-containing protein, partial [Planctomycetaceae bacterium]
EVEPNNSISQANEMVTLEPTASSSISSRLGGHIGHAGDSQDFFRLNLAENVINGRIVFNHSHRQRLNFQLLNQSERVISTGIQRNPGVKFVDAATLPAGTYYVRVFRESPAAASMWSATFTGTRVGRPVTPPQPPSSTTDIEPNDSRTLAGSIGTLTPDVTTTVRGSLTGSDPEDWYRVPLSSAGNLTVDMTGMTADLDLEIQDRNGVYLSSSSKGSSTSETITLTGLSAGDYFIRIKRYNGASSSYTLTAVSTASVASPGENTSMSTAANLGTASPGFSVTADGSVNGGVKWYRFQTNDRWNGTLKLGSVAGTSSQESVSNLPAGTYYLSIGSNLIGSKFLGELHNSFGVTLQSFTGAQSGDAFRVAVAVQTVAPPTPVIGAVLEPNDSRFTASAFGTLTPGRATVVRGSLSSRENEDWFAINLDRTSSITVDLNMENATTGTRRLNSLDQITHLQLVDQFGNVLSDSTPSRGGVYRGGLRLINRSSLSAGTYYLRVFRSSTGLASPYRLSVTPRTV